MSEKTLSRTVTGEVHQPVRLYYEMYRPENVIKILSRLKCIQRDPQKNRFVWLYQEEAASLKFSIPYQEINPELHPIVIGSFVVKPRNILICDVRSVKRALLAIPFFDHYISRKFAKVLNLAILNRYSQIHEDKGSCYDALFDDYPKKFQPPFDFASLADSVKGIDDPMQKILFLHEHTLKVGEKPLNEIETFPTNYYEDGIEALKATLVFREVTAIRHFLGDNRLSFNELIQPICDRIGYISAL
jgi:hypothetical protein